MGSDSDATRRRFLRLAGSGAVVAVAGCAGNGDTPSPEPTGSPTSSPTPEPVPAAYRTATSQGGDDRNPDSLQSKASVSYQSQPNDGQQCADCRFYIPDMNDDGMGACAIVAGTIDHEGWCTSFVTHDS